MLVRRIAVCVLLLAGWSSAAFADQAEWVTKEVADKVDTLVDYGMEVRHFCPLCGDKTYSHEVVASKEVQETDTPGHFTVLVNDVPIDLAYVYIEKDGKWSNLGKLAGASVDKVPEVLPADIPAGLSDFDRVDYVGLLDGHLAITAALSKNGGDMSGDYFYAHVGTPLNVSGEIDQLGTFTLNETDDDGKKTGAFSGKLSDNGAKAEGTWQSEDGAKKLSFALRRVALYGEEGGTIAAGSQASETHLDFPVFIADFGPGYAAVNEAIQASIRAKYTEYASQFASTGAELGLDDPRSSGDDAGQTISVGDHMIFLASENVVSVLFSISLFQGGAHGMTMSLPVNLRVSKSGDAVKANALGLGELLKPGADALHALSAYLVAELKKKNAGLVTSGDIKEFKAEDMDAFTISPKGLTVYFDPYAVASYAEGPFEVFVPFAALPDAFSADALKGIAEVPAAAAAPAAVKPAAK